MNQQDKDNLGLLWKPIAAYALWKVVRYFLTHIPFLNQFWEGINSFFAYTYIKLSVFILQLIGFEVSHNARNLILSGTDGIYVGNHCIGIPAAFVFVVIVLLFSGSFIKKVPYMIAGLIVIYIINWFRILSLAFMLKYGGNTFFDLNHKYIYLVLVYGIIFLMVIQIQKKLSVTEKT